MQTLKPKVLTLKPRTSTYAGTTRIRGRRLQATRLQHWIESPNCEICGTLTQYPYGFEIDHKTRLADGGAESRENRQLLCLKCHEDKTGNENQNRIT